MKKTFQITEYGSFIAEKNVDGYVTLPQSTFDALETFILTNKSKSTDALELLGLSAKKGLGKVITAKNYVGVITMNDGTTIEILPKIIYENQNEVATKRLLIEMLKTLRDSPYKSLQLSRMNIDQMSIFEVFIRMFIDEVLLIEKRGLRFGYETIESNESVFKGKLKVTEHIKSNIAHKERVYVEYDEFNLNRPENKLIKTTLQYLYRQSESTRNKIDIRNLLNSFSLVTESVDIAGDFSKCSSDRNMKDYRTALMWCKVFLMGKSFTTFSGSEIAFALLFPMESLFESYVAKRLRKYLGSSDYSISVQDRTYHLFDEPRQFQMKPDIVVTRKEDGSIFVLDTKWKVLSAQKANYGISQSDMYQMYAYQKKYQAEKMVLLYPATEELEPSKSIEFSAKDGVTVSARFLDLLNLQDSLERIRAEIDGADP